MVLDFICAINAQAILRFTLDHLEIDQLFVFAYLVNEVSSLD